MMKCKVFEELYENEIQEWLSEKNLKRSHIVNIFQSSEVVSHSGSTFGNISNAIGKIKTTIFYEES
jgi:hypothetical protein